MKVSAVRERMAGLCAANLVYEALRDTGPVPAAPPLWSRHGPCWLPSPPLRPRRRPCMMRPPSSCTPKRTPPSTSPTAARRSVAYVVAGILGLDASAYSVGYVAGWSRCDAETIKATAANVLRAAHTLADALITEAEAVAARGRSPPARGQAPSRSPTGPAARTASTCAPQDVRPRSGHAGAMGSLRALRDFLECAGGAPGLSLHTVVTCRTSAEWHPIPLSRAS